MIKIDSAYLLETLKDAVRINSVIPHEERLAAFFAEKIRGLGLEPEWHVVAEGRPNVYASVQLGPADGFIMRHACVANLRGIWIRLMWQKIGKPTRSSL